VTVPAGAPPALIGLVLHHAFAVINPGVGSAITTVSNAVPLRLIP
jgi:hypothetical protein